MGLGCSVCVRGVCAIPTVSVATSLTHFSTLSNLALGSSELGILLIRSLRDSRYAWRVSSSDTSLEVSNVSEDFCVARYCRHGEISGTIYTSRAEIGQMDLVN